MNLTFKEVKGLFDDDLAVYVAISLKSYEDDNACRYHVGLSSNLSRTMQSHNSGDCIPTKPFRPWALLFTVSGFENNNYLDAKRVESSIRQGLCEIISNDAHSWSNFIDVIHKSTNTDLVIKATIESDGSQFNGRPANLV